MSRYLASWMALAAFGVGYIGIAAVRPDLLSSVLPLPDQGADSAVAARNATDLVDELVTLRKWVNDLQHDLSAAKSAIQSQAEEGKLLRQRLAAAEERALPAATDRPGDPQVTAQSGPVKVLNSSSIETGSIAAPSAIASTPAKPAPHAAPLAATKVAVPAAPKQPGHRAIEIAGADSLDALRSQWSTLSSKHGSELGQLTPRYRISGADGSNPFTLLAGPFNTTADAAKACAQLRAGGVACRVSEYSGNSL